jgi:hypothetical protein
MSSKYYDENDNDLKLDLLKIISYQLRVSHLRRSGICSLSHQCGRANNDCGKLVKVTLNFYTL